MAVRKMFRIKDPVVITIAGLKEAPPAPAEIKREPHRVRVYVPEPEESTLTMGAGTPPGIRAETGTHIHLATKSPATTLSLGATGGPSLGAETAGVALKTGGALTEEVKEDVTLTHRKNVQHTIHEDRDTQIWGNDTLEVFKNQSTFVKGSLDIESGPRTDTVEGNYRIDCGPHHFDVNAASKKENILGAAWKTVGGDDDEVVRGRKATTQLGAFRTYTLGMKHEMTAAVNLAVHTLKTEYTGTNIGYKRASLERTKFRATRVDVDVYEAPKARVEKATAWISSIVMFVLK